MPDIRHVFTSPQVDATGTLTIWNGATTATVAASAIVKPSAWNSSHAGGLDFAASNTTYTSGTVILSGGANVTVGTNGQTITISGAAQSVQTQNMVAISASDALFSSGTVVLTGAGAATVNTAAGSIRISVPLQSAQTGISSLQGSDATYTSGKVIFTGVGGGITVSSNTGQRIDLSVAPPVAQTVQTQSLIAAMYDGVASISTGTVRLTNANGVSFSINGQTLSGSVGAGATATGNVGGMAINALTTYTSGTVVLSAGANISLGTNAQTVTISGVAAQTAQTQNLHNLTLSGNSTSAGAGYIQVSSGTLTLAGGNNITLSQNGNAVTISGANAGGAQTAISGLANSETTYTSGSVTFSALGAMTIRSTTGQHFQFSVNSQTVQTQNMVALSASDALFSSGTVVLTGLGAATVNTAAGSIRVSVPVQSAQTQANIAAIQNSETTYQTGTVNLSVVGGAMTIRSTTGQAFQFSVSQSAQAAQTGISSIAGSNTTYTSGQVEFTGSNMVTVKSSANQRIVIDATQSVQTQSLINASLSGNSTSAGAGYILMSSGTMILAGGNNVTLSQNGMSVTISGAAAGGVQTAISGLANSETTYTSGSVTLSALGAITIRSTTGQHFQFSVNSQTAQTGISGISNSNTTYTSGTVGLSELGAITIRSTTGNQFQFSVAAQTAATGISGLSNSNTTYTSGTVGLSELGAITIRSTTGNQFQFSVNSQTVQTQSLYSAGISNLGNTAGSTGITGTRNVFVGTNDITLSGSTDASGGTISFIYSRPSMSYWDNFSPGAANPGVILATAHGSMTVFPLAPYWPADMTANTALFNFSLSHTNTSSSTLVKTLSLFFGIYTTANSTQLSLLNSVSVAVTAAATSDQSSAFHGARFMTIHSSAWSSQPVFKRGSHYHGALFVLSAGEALAGGSHFGQIFQTTAQRSGTVGTSVVTNTTMGPYPWHGIWSASTNALPGAISRASLGKTGSAAYFLPHIIFNNEVSSF